MKNIIAYSLSLAGILSFNVLSQVQNKPYIVVYIADDQSCSDVSVWA